MSFFGWTCFAIAVMSLFMAVCVSFDSKTWESETGGGLFEFKHRIMAWLNFPMLFLVPILAVLGSMLVPLGESDLLHFLYRFLILFGVLVGSAYIFFIVTMICVGMKEWYKQIRNKAAS